jgi:hypothetical protein
MWILTDWCMKQVMSTIDLIASQIEKTILTQEILIIYMINKEIKKL